MKYVNQSELNSFSRITDYDGLTITSLSFDPFAVDGAT